MRYDCDVLYAVLYVRVSCFVVRGCAVWRRYINVCNCDMFGVVNVYLDHSFLISMRMFIVSKALLISSATVIVRAGGVISITFTVVFFWNLALLVWCM